MASQELLCVLIPKYFAMTSVNWAGMLLSISVGDPCSVLLSFTSDDGISDVSVN